jgi:hypothetical protein
MDRLGRQADGECRLTRFGRLFGQRRELTCLRFVDRATFGGGRVGTRGEVKDFGIADLSPTRGDRFARVLRERKLGAGRDEEYRGKRARRG